MLYIHTTYDIVLCEGLKSFDEHFEYVKDYLKDLGCKVFAPVVSLEHSIDYRANQLRTKIESYLSNNYGSAEGKPVHLICHCVGGLDARRLAYMNPKFNILSITTVSTPHHGSPIAAWSDSLGFFARIASSPLLGMLDGSETILEDMRPERMKTFNSRYPGVAGIKYFSVGAKFDPWRTHLYYSSHKFIRNYLNSRGYPDAFGPNNGIVSVNSAKWGETLNFVNYDTSHFGLLGCELLRSLGGADSDFDAKRLYCQLVDNVARNVENRRY